MVAPGTKLVSKNVKYSTTQKTGLAVGCYKVKEPSKDIERILIITDENNTSCEKVIKKNNGNAYILVGTVIVIGVIALICFGGVDPGNLDKGMSTKMEDLDFLF